MKTKIGVMGSASGPVIREPYAIASATRLGAAIAKHDCILITGSNTTEAHPLVASRILKAKEKGAKLIVIDPRKTQIACYADIFVRQRLGTDVAWINGLMHIILKEGWEDKEFIASRTEGFEELKKEVEKYPPEKVEEITGISASRMSALSCHMSPTCVKCLTSS